MSLDLCNCPLKIRESIGTPILKVGAHLGVWGFIPSHSPTFREAWNVILGLHSWLASLQAFTLIANPMLRLRQFCHYQIKTMNNNWENIQASINHQTYMPSFFHKIIFLLEKPVSLFFNNPHHPFLKSHVITLPLYWYALYWLQETIVTISHHIGRQLTCLFVMST
jgi:hypothetical protein